MFRRVGIRNDTNDTTELHVLGKQRVNTLHVIADFEERHLALQGKGRQSDSTLMVRKIDKNLFTLKIAVVVSKCNSPVGRLDACRRLLRNALSVVQDVRHDAQIAGSMSPILLSE